MDESRIESLVRENAALKRTVDSLMDVSEARQAGKKLGTSFRLFGENLALQHLVDEKTVALRKPEAVPRLRKTRPCPQQAHRPQPPPQGWHPRGIGSMPRPWMRF